MGRIGERVLEQDDLLRASWILRDDDEALVPVFDRLADVCLDQLFLDLELKHVVGDLSDDEYMHEAVRLITQCRRAGLKPPVTVHELRPGAVREPHTAEQPEEL